jgi:hypothetical protein
MKTWIRNCAGIGAVVLATSMLTSRVVSQQHDEQMEKMQEEMARWMELAKPGKQHAELTKTAGMWQQQITHWMYPGAEPEMSTGTARLESILGGRFILERVNASAMFGSDQKFEGLGIRGFDNATQKHVFAWVDNMGTTIMTGEGTPDASGKAVTFLSECAGPGGESYQMKSVSRAESDDRHVYEMYSKLEDGTWFRNMEIVYTRPAAAPRGSR